MTNPTPNLVQEGEVEANPNLLLLLNLQEGEVEDDETTARVATLLDGWSAWRAELRTGSLVS